MRLSDLVKPNQVNASLKSTNKVEIIEDLAELLVNGDDSVSHEELCRVLLERERLRSTSVGSGVAIPHGKLHDLDHTILAVGLSHEGVDFDAADDRPVHIFMALAAPFNSTGKHLKVLAKIARLCSDVGFRERLLSCVTDEDVYTTLIEEDARLAH